MKIKKGDFYDAVILLFCSILKFLLVPCYFSTDFDVHRNWLSLTHSLPHSQWYFENTSQWTLDYPPLFAWFEYFLSLFAQLFDPEMLKISSLPYHSPETLFFQRTTVILADVILFFSIKSFCKTWPNERAEGTVLGEGFSYRKARIILLLTFSNAGLLLVDHIHFQYNGMLLGLLIYSVSFIRSDNIYKAAFTFSILLNMKHLFLYLAPVYFIFLLRSSCYKDRHFDFSILLKLAAVVSSVFAVSFGPFLNPDQLKQIFSRLFPFGRGLTHAYWAPNFWALYNTLDIGLAVLTKRGSSTQTRGLVRQGEFVFLPSISPAIALTLTLIALTPILRSLWNSPHKKSFLHAVCFANLAGFMFGFHVHEKAILTALIPMILLALDSVEDAKLALFLSVSGTYSLFPLLFTPFESVLKLLIFGFYTVCFT